MNGMAKMWDAIKRAARWYVAQGAAPTDEQWRREQW